MVRVKGFRVRVRVMVRVRVISGDGGSLHPDPPMIDLGTCLIKRCFVEQS